MASKAIRGINLEIGGNTVKLKDSLRSAENQIGSLNKEANQLNKSLKFDSTNVDLLSQKSIVLGKSFESVSEKLKTLKANQDMVNKGFDASGNKLTTDQIREYNTEVATTASYLKGLEGQIEKTNTKLENAKNGFATAKDGTAVLKGGLTEVKDEFRAAGNESTVFADMLKANLASQVILDVTKKIVTEIKNIGVALVETSAIVKAEKAQFKAAFDDIGGDAISVFQNISSATGILEERLQRVGTSGFSQLKGSGMEAGLALKKTAEFTNHAADAAAFYDISLEDAAERLQSFIQGNTTAGRSIGIFTSEAQRNEKALAAYNQQFKDLNESQKQMVRLDITKTIYEANGAMGQATREADGYENVMGNLSETFKQFQATVGESLLEAVVPKIQEITATMGGMDEIAEKIGESVAGVFNFIVDNSGAIIASISAIGAAMVAAKAKDFVVSIAGLATPAGLVSVGIGLAAAAVAGFATHLATAKNEIEQTTERLNETSGAAEKAAESFENISADTSKWRDLKTQIENNNTATGDLKLTTEELTTAKEELARIESIIVGNSDGLISKMSLENGLTEEQIILVERLAELQKEQAIRDLEQSIRDYDTVKVDKQINKQQEKFDRLMANTEAEQLAYAELIPIIEEYEQVMNDSTLSSEEQASAVQKLNGKARGLGDVLGFAALNFDSLDYAQEIATNHMKDTSEAIDKQKEKMKENLDAQSTYQGSLLQLDILTSKTTESTKKNTNEEEKNTKAVLSNIEAAELAAEQYLNTQKAISVTTSAYEKLTDGVELSKDELEYLINTFPEIADKIADTGVASLNAKDIILAANGQIIFSSEAKKQAAIADAKANITAAQEEAELVRAAYEQEINAIIAVIKARQAAGASTSKLDSDLLGAVTERDRANKASDEQIAKAKEALKTIEAIEVSTKKTAKASGGGGSSKTTEKENKALKEQLKLLDDKKALSEMSAKEEIEALENIRKNYAKTDEEKIDIDKKTYALKKKLAQDEEKELIQLGENVTKAMLAQYEEEYNGTDGKITKVNESIAEIKDASYKEIEIAGETTSQKMKLYDDEFIEKIRFIDEATALSLDGINAEIDAELEKLGITNAERAEEIQALRDKKQSIIETADAEKKADAEVAYNKKVLRLQEQLNIAETTEEIERLNEQMADLEAERDRKARNEKREEDKKAIDEEIKDKQRLWKEEVEAAKVAIEEKKKLQDLEVLNLSTEKETEKIGLSAELKSLVDFAPQAAADMFNAIAKEEDEAIARMKALEPTLQAIGSSFIDRLNLGREETQGELIDGMEETGEDAAQGFIIGLQNKEPEIISKAQRIADLVRSTIQSALDIHSPSRVMMALGEFTGEGFSTGIENTVGLIEKAAVRLGVAAMPSVASVGMDNIGNASASSMGNQTSYNPTLVIENYHQHTNMDIQELNEKLGFLGKQKKMARGG